MGTEKHFVLINDGSSANLVIHSDKKEIAEIILESIVKFPKEWRFVDDVQIKYIKQ